MKKTSKETLVSKVQRAVRARALGMKNYKRADALLAQVRKLVQPGEVVKISDQKAYKLVDKFEGKDIVWNPCAARRWDLEEVDVAVE